MAKGWGWGGVWWVREGWLVGDGVGVVGEGGVVGWRWGAGGVGCGG